LNELITERHRDLYLNYFNMSPKGFFYKRFLLALLSLFPYLVITLQLGNPLLIVGIPFYAFLVFKIPYLKLISRKEKDDLIKTHLFPKFLRYFICLLGTQGNVYQTLRATLPYLEQPIKGKVQQLVSAIEKKNRREDYMEFANYIGTSEANMVMSLIYDFSENGIKKDELEELERLIDAIKENRVEELIQLKTIRMERHANPPLIVASCFVLFFVVVVVVYGVHDAFLMLKN